MYGGKCSSVGPFDERKVGISMVEKLNNRDDQEDRAKLNHRRLVVPRHHVGSKMG